MPFPQRVWLLLGSLSPSKFGDEISSFADPGCLSQIPDRKSDFFSSQIPDSGSKFFPSWIPDPGSKFFPSRILDPGSASKNLSILTKKKWFLSSQKYDPDFPPRIRIPDLDPDFLPIPNPDPVSQIPNPGVKKAPEPWSRIPDPDSQYWRFWLCSGCRGYRWLLTFNGTCCLNNSFNGSAFSSFYVQKRILHIFYFNIISLIFTVFKLWCPAHLFPNTPRIWAQMRGGGRGVAGFQPMSTAVHNAHRAQINDLIFT